MTFEEYQKWQKSNQPKAYADSTKKRWRTQAKKAISQAIELAKAEQRDVKESIFCSCTWSDKNTTQALIWLQESHAVLWKLKLWNLPKN